MSEAPERIFAFRSEGRVYVRTHWIQKEHEGEKLEGGTEYLRADLAGLPEDLVERLRVTEKELSPYEGIRVIIEDILRWHEQQKGEKE